MRKNETIDEIVDYVLEHGGPDLDRRAHHKKKRVRYSDLDTALARIHGMGELSDLRAYHFNSVLGIWNEGGITNKRLAREMVDELMQRLTQRCGSLTEVIKNISGEPFQNEQFEFKTSDGVVTYKLLSMLSMVSFDDRRLNSTYSAVKYWIDTHPDGRIRREYAGLRPWHFAKSASETWSGEEGKRNGRVLVDELMQRLTQKYGSLTEAIKNVSTDHFLKEGFEFTTSDGSISYNLGGMFCLVRFDDKHQSCVYSVVKYWIDTHPDGRIRREYAGLKPWHFSQASQETWVGKQSTKNGQELVDQLMQRLTKRHGSLIEAINNISGESFENEKFEFKTSDGVITYNLGTMLKRVKFDDNYTHSTYSAVKYWVDNHQNERIRREYSGLRPWHFTKAARETWMGEIGRRNGRELVDQLMQRLTQRYGNLVEAIKNVSTEHFLKEGFEFTTSDGVITYDLNSMFHRLKFDNRHNCSSYYAVKYWVDNHQDERIRREYSGLRPWHFAKSANETWSGEEGKRNGRELVDELMQRLTKRHGNLAEAIKNVSEKDFLNEEFEFKTSDGAITYNLNSMFHHVKFDNRRDASIYYAVKYWIDTHPDERIRKEYAGLNPWYMSVASMGTWSGEEGKRNGRELVDELMQRLTKRHGSLTEAIKNISKEPFQNEQFEFKTSDGVITYNLGSMFQRVKFNDKHSESPYAVVKYWIDTHPDERIRREYAGLKPWHMSKACMGVWEGEEGKRNGIELVEELMQRLTQKHGSLNEVIKNMSQEPFQKEQFDFKTSDGVITYNLRGMFQRVKFDDKHSGSPYAVVKYWIDTHPDETLKEKYVRELEVLEQKVRHYNPHRLLESIILK